MSTLISKTRSIDNLKYKYKIDDLNLLIGKLSINNYNVDLMELLHAWCKYSKDYYIHYEYWNNSYWFNSLFIEVNDHTIQIFCDNITKYLYNKEIKNKEHSIIENKYINEYIKLKNELEETYKCLIIPYERV